MPGGIRQEKLEDAVWHKVTEALLNPVNLRTELSLRRTEREARLEDKQQQMTAIQEELAEAERKLGVLLDQVLVSGFPESVVQERKDVLLARRKHLLTEVKRLQPESEPSYPSVDDEEVLIQFAEHIQDTLQYVDFDAKRRVLEMLQVRVDVVSQDTIKLSAMIPFRQESVTDLSVDQDVNSSDAHQSDGSIARISSA